MQVKDQLNKAKSAVSVTPLEARDARLGCFVTIHGETLKRGALLMGEKLSDEETERQDLHDMHDQVCSMIVRKVV